MQPRLLGSLSFLFLSIASLAFGQDKSGPTPTREMQVTNEGFIALDTPKGWERSNGPGLLFYLKKGVSSRKADVWIYVSGYPIGPSEQLKNLEDCVQSDVNDFQARFKSGTVRVEEPLILSDGQTQVPVRTFLSGESRNAFEEVIYIPEQTRVLSFVLSAKSEQAYKTSIPTFRTFVQSYGGSIVLGGHSKQP